MSRMLRRQWRERAMPLTFGGSKRRRLDLPEPRPVRRIDLWDVILADGRRCLVAAYTAGEARSLAKSKFGLPQNDRLPEGATVTKREPIKAVA